MIEPAVAITAAVVGALLSLAAFLAIAVTAVSHREVGPRIPPTDVEDGDDNS